MNYLAHCLLGARAADPAEHDALVAGGFLGDFIKGRVPDAMPADLALGVRLHRRIDAYSNQQPDIRASCERFPPELRRIAPILVDIVCDHLLARRWHEFHHGPINDFTAGAYRSVAAHDDWLTDAGRRFLDYAAEEDLLARYRDWDVIARAMRSITRRLRREELNTGLEASVRRLLDDLDEDFSRYFPELIAHADRWVHDQR